MSYHLANNQLHFDLYWGECIDRGELEREKEKDDMFKLGSEKSEHDREKRGKVLSEIGEKKHEVGVNSHLRTKGTSLIIPSPKNSLIWTLCSVLLVS